MGLYSKYTGKICIPYEVKEQRSTINSYNNNGKNNADNCGISNYLKKTKKTSE